MERTCKLCHQTFWGSIHVEKGHIADTKGCCPLCYLRCCTTWPRDADPITHASCIPQDNNFGFVCYLKDGRVFIYTLELRPEQVQNPVDHLFETTNYRIRIHYAVDE